MHLCIIAPVCLCMYGSVVRSDWVDWRLPQSQHCRRPQTERLKGQDTLNTYVGRLGFVALCVYCGLYVLHVHVCVDILYMDISGRLYEDCTFPLGDSS